MSAIQQPTPNHQGETFGSLETQFFVAPGRPGGTKHIWGLGRRACGRAGCNSPCGGRKLNRAPRADQSGRLDLGKRAAAPVTLPAQDQRIVPQSAYRAPR